MKWEPVENAEKVLENGELVLCWIVILDQYCNDNYETFEVCIYTNDELSVLDEKLEHRYYRITHFMVIEEPNNENTNQAS